MTVIKASCPTCGDVDLKPGQIRLTDGPRGFYAFNCAQCGQMVRKDADDGVRALLRSGGVVVEHVPDEAWALHVGPRISYDDLLDAALLLRGETDVLRVLLNETREERA